MAEPNFAKIEAAGEPDEQNAADPAGGPCTEETMPVEAAILTLAQWLSPAYPVGAFAYSHGLEWSVEAGEVGDAAGLQDWIAAVLEHGGGWNDALFLASAFHARDPDAVDDMARAFAASAERRRETELMGAAFARASTEIWGTPMPPLCYPVALGVAARQAGLPLRLTLQMYLQAMAGNLVAAGIRLVPLGQSEGQGVLRALLPLCLSLGARAEGADLDDLSSTAFLTDIASMHHETQYSRIFRT